MEIFESEEHFKKGIKKLLTGSFFGKFKVDDLKPVSYDIYGEKTYTSADSKHKSESTMRSLLRRYTGTQCVSNFRPTASLFISKLYETRRNRLGYVYGLWWSYTWCDCI